MNKKILIIEDNESNLFLLSTTLRIHGYKTIEAKNGLEGVKLAIKERPHLILTDIQMPIMDGFEVCSFLRSEPSTKDIPSIAITSYAEKGDREKFIEFGFTDYIPKPISLKEFVKIIDNHLRQSF